MDDDDFVVRERPRRRRAPAPGRFKALLQILMQVLLHVLLAPLLQRPGRSLAVIVFAGITTAFLVNALMMQRRLHPSPMFRPVAREKTVPPVARSADAKPQKDVIVLPPLRPLDRIGPSDARPAQNTKASDSIADMIRNAGAERGVEPSRQVMAAQRALAKLNYAVKPDGVMGATTRSAIERFERDRNLPITGELGPRVAKALSAATGVPVE
jgi:hypothetical protein